MYITPGLPGADAKKGHKGALPPVLSHYSIPYRNASVKQILAFFPFSFLQKHPCMQDISCNGKSYFPQETTRQLYTNFERIASNLGNFIET